MEEYQDALERADEVVRIVTDWYENGGA
jgi:hypothetical protein